MAQDAHIMFPISAEFKAMIELAAEEQDTTVAGLIKKVMGEYVGYDYSGKTGAVKKYANAEERKEEYKKAQKARRALVADLIEKYKADQKAKAAEELAQAELEKKGREAARNAQEPRGLTDIDLNRHAGITTPGVKD